MGNSQNNTAQEFKIMGYRGSQSKGLKSKPLQLTDEYLKYEMGIENELLKKSGNSFKEKL